jgi:predicted O-methyltransferase YrrM
VPLEDVSFAKRYPYSIELFVIDSLKQLARAGIIDEPMIDCAHWQGVWQEIRSRYEHGDYGTYIYPEEGILLLALAETEAPKNALFLGSYYGYWAAWAIPGIAGGGGRVTLIDPDSASCGVAALNIGASAHSTQVRVVTATGQEFLRGCDELFDFVVIDAELPATHPDPAERGKGIYFSLLRAALPNMTRSALLVCHNILFSDHSGDPFFSKIIARNLQQLSRFRQVVAQEFGNFKELSSTEGVGVGRRHSRC